MGAEAGFAVGFAVGAAVCTGVGTVVGVSVTAAVGASVGTAVGASVGAAGRVGVTADMTTAKLASLSAARSFRSTKATPERYAPAVLVLGDLEH